MQMNCHKLQVFVENFLRISLQPWASATGKAAELDNGDPSFDHALVGKL